jgi:hypothetical protein
MPYNSLLLQMGGGISSEQSVSPRYAGSAALCIGIGGTGMRALAALKKKVYDHIEPDDPYSPVKAYSQIQFLGIDSDETELDYLGAGESALKRDEFFSIKDPSRVMVVRERKDLIKNNPLYNWMEMDQIRALHSNQATGGVRQVGRYLLFRKAGELRHAIAAKARAALTGQSPAALDVYIMAGISGGTGGGCFLDTCYIVRDVVERQMGVGGILAGLFFLPDVMSTRPDVPPETARHNRSNGYAAMKELDYLMGLNKAGETFNQDYGDFRIDTDRPPVDMCHLVSACDINGAMPVDAFQHSVEAVADYVLSHLVDDGLDYPTEPSWTMRGLDCRSWNMVGHIPNACGAGRYYRAVGSAVAEVPFGQFMTYAACGLYGRFAAAVGRGRRLPTAKEVDDLAEDLGLTCLDIQNSLERGCEPLYLTDMSDDLKELARYGVPEIGHLPDVWSEKTGNPWTSECADQRRNNSEGLTRRPDELVLGKVKSDSTSLVAKAFARLCQIACDPAYGPYYAAALLRGGHSLVTCASGACRGAQEQAADNAMYLKDDKKNINDSATKFVARPNKKRYEAYYRHACDWYRHFEASRTFDDVAEAARLLGDALDWLYDSFFGPLTDCLDRLGETFAQNAAWLAGAGAQSDSHMVELANVKDELDNAVAALGSNDYVTRFVGALLDDPEAWSGDDEERLASLVSRFMGDAFGNLTSLSVAQCINKKYPDMTPRQQEAAVEGEIVRPAYERAAPKFWRDPLYDSGDCFESFVVSVPASCAVLVEAANNLVALLGDSANLTVRKTGLSDRVTVLRLCDGIPLYAYQGVVSMKSDYDRASEAETAGLHLYAETGRGTDGSGDHDWGTELPAPVPYSFAPQMFPNGPRLEELYTQGLGGGVIARVTLADGATTEWRILYSDPEEPRPYAAADFAAPDGALDAGALGRERAAVQARLDARRNNPTDYLCMIDDGDDAHKEQVRFDHFVHFRHWQEVVEAELASRRALEDELAQLDAIGAGVAQTARGGDDM